MRINGPSAGEIYISLAELIRQDETLSVEERMQVKKVTYWADTTHWRYPGTSSEWQEFEFTVYYDTWWGEEQAYTVRGTKQEIFDRLALLVEHYTD